MTPIDNRLPKNPVSLPAAKIWPSGGGSTASPATRVLGGVRPTRRL